MKYLLTVLIGISISSTCSAAKILSDIVYVKRGDVELKMDIALPVGDAKIRPAVMCIHGGGWKFGHRQSYSKPIEQIASLGYVGVTVSYRLVDVARWPAQIEDVKAALQFLTENADKYGIDPERIGVMGDSAGGHLALLLGTMGSETDRGARVRGVINFYGPAEMRKPEYVTHARQLVEGLIGGKLEDNVEKLKAISPITYVTRTDAPVLTFQGTEDNLVPMIQSRVMHEALTKAQIPNQLVSMEGVGHRIGGDVPKILSTIQSFGESYLVGSRLPLLVSEDFDQGADNWQPTDPDAWKTATKSGRTVFSLVKKRSKYEPKVRSPYNIAMFKDVSVGDFVLDVDLKSTHEPYGHQDLCLFFGYQDPSHFYYVHIGRKADAHANSIFLVNDKPRVSIAKERTDGTDWSKGWHRARIKRDTKSGKIEVYFDNMQKPIMSTTDKTFTTGRVGIGSFDDTGDFDAIRLWGRRSVGSKR